MRNPSLPFVVLTVAAALSAPACGNFSQEDLLFRAAVPSKASFALTPPGAEEAPASTVRGSLTQALGECGEADPDGDHLRCVAQRWAVGFNQLTFSLLDVVDGIVQNEPSRRAAGKRVWGPHFVDGRDGAAGFTARFEMRRHDDGETFSYCLHVKAGASLPGADDDVDCDVEVSERGFVRFLSGTFVAGVDDEHLAKSGRGTMVLEARNLPDGGDGFFNALDSIEFAYDSRVSTDVALNIVFEDESIVPWASHFVRAADGSGRFEFELDLNIDETATLAPEHLMIVAEWNADLAGRAEADVTEGDVPSGQSYHVVECWSAAPERVYLQQTFGDDESVEGELAACAIQTPLVM